jgi:hypothetical protein
MTEDEKLNAFLGIFHPDLTDRQVRDLRRDAERKRGRS